MFYFCQNPRIAVRGNVKFLQYHDINILKMYRKQSKMAQKRRVFDEKTRLFCYKN